jgi:2-amino-4-hydroxy-6-hydroxymethyldihydropteridine diphosphokinase
MVVAINTSLGIADLAAQLRQIEVEHGRPEHATRFSARQLDIDVLTYDELVGVFDSVVLPRGEILENAFVLQPLAELASQVIHPQRGVSYGQLWDEYAKDTQRLCIVDFEWRGRLISTRSAQ